MLLLIIEPSTSTNLTFRFVQMACEEFHDEENDDYCVDEDHDGIFECGNSKMAYDSIGSGSEGYYLRSDYTLKCFESDYYWYMAVSLVGLAIYAAVPVAYFILLYRVRNKLDPGQEAMVSSQVVMVGQELLHVKDETEETISRALLKGGKLGILDLKGALNEAIRQRTISEKLDPKVRRLQFLYDPYEPKFWYFELVECARRIVFTAVIGFVSNGSVLQVIVSMLLAIMFVRIYNATSPFVKDSHDSLAEIAQWQTFLTMFCALVIKTQENGATGVEENKWVDMAIVLVQLIIPGLLAYQFLSTGKLNSVSDEAIREDLDNEKEKVEKKGGKKEEEEEEEKEKAKKKAIVAAFELKIKAVEDSAFALHSFVSEKLKAAGVAYATSYAECANIEEVSEMDAREGGFGAAVAVLEGASRVNEDTRSSREILKELVREKVKEFVENELIESLVLSEGCNGEVESKRKSLEQMLQFLVGEESLNKIFDLVFGGGEVGEKDEERQEGGEDGGDEEGGS